MWMILFVVSITLMIPVCFLSTLQEHNHVFAHAQDIDFLAGGQEFKDAAMVI